MPVHARTPSWGAFSFGSASDILRRPAQLILALSLVLLLPPGIAWPQSLTEPGDRGAGPLVADQPAEPETSDQPAQQERQSSIGKSLPPWLADPGGGRAALEAAGVTYLLTYIGDALGTARGGLRRDTTYMGRLDFQLEVDFERMAGLNGLVFHMNAYDIHGKGLSGCCIHNLLVASGLEAIPQVRLYELSLEQKLWQDRFSIRAGQLAGDTEFLVSQYAGLFVNASFGWPAISATGLPGGGPAYPTATPGVRIKIAPIDEASLSVAVFNGDPVGAKGIAHPQRRDRSGFEFRTTDPATFMAEGAYAYRQGRRLPGIVKFGGWHHLGSFRDMRFGEDGLSLAHPASSGAARRHRGNSGAYVVLDQLIYRVPNVPDGGIGFFVRLAASPERHNFVSLYGDGGLTFKGLLPGRPRDTFGLALSYVALSNRIRGLDRDGRLFSLAEEAPVRHGYPVRSSEMLVEVTYQAEVRPGLTLQPDLQYIRRPGAVAATAAYRGSAAKNALVGGLRATIRY